MLRINSQVPPAGNFNPIFCYADIQSPTSLWDEHREPMLWAQRQHDDLCEVDNERYDDCILHPRFSQSSSRLYALPGGSQMIGVGHDGMLRSWDFANMDEQRVVKAHDGQLSEVNLSLDSYFIVAASTDDVL